MSPSPALPASRPARQWSFPPLLPPLHFGWAPPGPAAAAAAVAAATPPGRAAPWTALPVPLATRDAAAAADAASMTAGREAAFRAAAPPGYVTNYHRRVVGRGEQAWHRASAALTSTAALRLSWVAVTVVRAAAPAAATSAATATAAAATAATSTATAASTDYPPLLAPGDALVIAARPLPLPLWSVNVNRVLAVTAAPPPAPPSPPPSAAAAARGRGRGYSSDGERVALVWGTTPAHALRGEELVTLTRRMPGRGGGGGAGSGGGGAARRGMEGVAAAAAARGQGAPAAAAAPAEAAEVVFELVSYSRGHAVPARLGALAIRAMQRAYARGVADALTAATAAAGATGGG
ncbi:hypothetical protein I4F81_002987 [Pyropia yezoensis]|uniref:Uncharacterized protein n=1 Tax=Pyropia yezoensis TaxID=2788 RepID=A0ACC3BS43_PYRYE|nr:hypothetical protein I4F81_002987 [Neopyropia yezoensis]